jgi:hypothetical protein
VVDWHAVPDPAQETRNRIWSRSPDFILFDEADRSIQSAYTFDETLIANVPPAVANLAGTASRTYGSIPHDHGPMIERSDGHS